jgi:SpoVK/Ycf46/Vps4 family AAA+-type ATPase
MYLDVTAIKECYVGESEKNTKEFFASYRSLVKSSKTTPILLLNEADQVLSKRQNIGNTNPTVTQMENAIQNIILEEMETLDGILIATTNMTQNLDKAFERRFLYKIEFEKPDLEAKKAIWRSIIPELDENTAWALAKKYNFSGGQIENIARRQTVSSILTGAEITLNGLCSFCEEETIEKESRPVGFSVK